MSTEDVSRRKLLVMMGGVAIGAFVMQSPAATAAPADATPLVDPLTKEVLPPSMKRLDLMIAPIWGQGYNYRREQIPILVYLTGDGQMRVWYPDNDEELAEMERFYAATRTPGRPDVDPATIFPIVRSPEETALIQAIVAAPDSDPPRLAYADWLTKRGDDLGEYIRLACENARYSDQKDPRAIRADRATQPLLDKHGKTWNRPLAALGLWPLMGSEFAPFLFFRRGMIERIDVMLPGILPEKAEWLWQAAPLLNELRFNCVVDVPELVALPQMRQIRELTIYNERKFEVTSEAFRAIVASPNLGRLRILNLGNSQRTDEDLELLVQSRLLGQLTGLSLSNSGLSGRALVLLAQSPKAGNLNVLDIAGCAPDDAAITALAQSTSLRKLEKLNLSRCGLTGNQLQILVAANWPRLKELSLQSCKQADSCGRTLAQAAGLAGLEKLELVGTPLGPEGALTLAASPHLQHINQMSVSAPDIGEEGASALRARFGERVYLNSN